MSADLLFCYEELLTVPGKTGLLKRSRSTEFGHSRHREMAEFGRNGDKIRPQPSQIEQIQS